jgi:hypothetical protein
MRRGCWSNCPGEGVVPAARDLRDLRVVDVRAGDVAVGDRPAAERDAARGAGRDAQAITRELINTAGVADRAETRAAGEDRVELERAALPTVTVPLPPVAPT